MVGGAFVLAETFLLYPLRHVASVSSLGIVYLLGVLVVSAGWGPVLGIATAVASGLAYDYFHLSPVHTLTTFDSRGWVVFPVFLTVALLASHVAQWARARTVEADDNRRTADLMVELAKILLCTQDVRSALPTASRCLAQALKLPYAKIELAVLAADERRVAFPLRNEGKTIGTLLVPAGLPGPTRWRLRDQVVPSLEALVSAACDRRAMAEAAEASRDDFRRIAEEQAGLRRVATCVARGVAQPEVFKAVAGEMGHILQARYIGMTRFEPDGMMTIVGNWADQRFSDRLLPLGSQWLIQKGSVSERVWRTGRPERLDRYEGDGEIATWAREKGLRSSVGCPIVVEGRLWGAMVAFSVGREPLPAGTEERMLHFTELVATAIGNAESRTELTASRARLVASADQTRRRIERDLHDGVQQRLIALGLELRAAEATMPAEQRELRTRLSHTARGLAGVVEDLREISRGLHPAVLSKGGLGPALKMLARRSSIPVELNIRADRRPAEPIEAAVYYIASEALTNVAKHAHASLVHIDLTVEDTIVRLSITDDGAGGANPSHGSGLIGLIDRVDVLGGNIEITSPVGNGTSLHVTIPVHELSDVA
ncbi:sensor histidine kinase [Actinomadura scrupuli]|uniref:sensor histidine kinase n=1 Tax=Actinomadura scrupuli TaxID=559629 RepID=UPI003D995D85